MRCVHRSTVPTDRDAAPFDGYYGVRGWDDDGVPAPETLDRLDLSEFAAFADAA